MLKIGETNVLEVAKLVDFGAYLNSDRGEILLPNKYITHPLLPGDEIEVFIYKDSEDRLIATNLQPKGKVNEFAVLRVKQLGAAGAFMEWGLEKDLLVPHSEQHRPMQEGINYLVRIVLDPKTDRLIGISKIAAFLNPDISTLSPGQPVSLIVYEQTDLGYMCLIEKSYKGILYENELFKPLAVGDFLSGYIKKVRDDGKIDLTLKKFGYSEIGDAKEVVMKKLENAGLSLPFSDSSDPEAIKREFQMSKKVFKKALGALYKEGRIVVEANAIRLTDSE